MKVAAFSQTLLYERHLVVNRPTSRFERPAQTDRPQGGSGRRPRKTANRRGVRSVGAQPTEGGPGSEGGIGRVGSRVTPHMLAAAVNKLVSLLVSLKLSCS